MGMVDKGRRILDLSRRRAKEGHLSTLRQGLEMLLLLLLRGMGPGYYHMAGLWRIELSVADKLRHPPRREYQRLLKRVNPEPYRKLSQNKIAEKAILALFRVPTPRFLGRLSVTVGRDGTGRALTTVGSLEALLTRERIERVVFKQLEGSGGKGIRIAEIQPGPGMSVRELGSTVSIPFERYCADILTLSEGGDWLIEEYLHQHPVIAALNPSSVNTIRIWVLRHDDRSCEVLVAYLRIGRRGSFVDNVASGGLIAPIDLTTGRLGMGQHPGPSRERHAQHPDHHVSIEGVEIPFWDDVKQVASSALTAFPGLRFAGLDIAIGSDGPYVIELNVIPDREGAGRLDGTVFDRLRQEARRTCRVESARERSDPR